MEFASPSNVLQLGGFSYAFLKPYKYLSFCFFSLALSRSLTLSHALSRSPLSLSLFLGSGSVASARPPRSCASCTLLAHAALCDQRLKRKTERIQKYVSFCIPPGFLKYAIMNFKLLSLNLLVLKQVWRVLFLKCSFSLEISAPWKQVLFHRNPMMEVVCFRQRAECWHCGKVVLVSLHFYLGICWHRG